MPATNGKQNALPQNVTEKTIHSEALFLRPTCRRDNQSTWISEIKYRGIQNRIKPNAEIEAQFKGALNMTNTDLTQTRPNTNILYKYKIHLILWASLCSPKRDTPPSHVLSEYFSNNLNIKHP